MFAAAALLANSVPVAGLYAASEDREDIRDLFIVSYVGAAGMLLSAIAYVGGFLSTAGFAH